MQRFRSLTWVWVILLPGVGALWYSAYRQLILGEPVGNRPASNPVLLLFWFAFGLALPAWFFFGGLRTEVRDDGVHLQAVAPPLCSQHIDYSEIATYEARRYRPLRDFGGWGPRFGQGGKAYTVSGNRGVQLVFKDGRRLLIGSQKADQLVEAIDRHMFPGNV
ncbi:MAG: DUF6141 family protein [Cyanobacteria bacterium J06626_23]